MRLFFDANVMTYIAFFEGYLSEGTEVEFRADCQNWMQLQGALDDQLLNEIHALRRLYVLDDHAHFDWLCSDIAITEVLQIRQALKRNVHIGLLYRLIEHRRDVYQEEEATISSRYREAIRRRYFAELPRKMLNDARQCCEALMVESDFFLTNDDPFIKKARASQIPISVCQVSDIPFI